VRFFRLGMKPLLPVFGGAERAAFGATKDH
jgi:hypothetical protein